ncbi:Mucin-5B [Xylographa soralifera]|nr:Mucin-5B [Xylographa soralifera]
MTRTAHLFAFLSVAHAVSTISGSSTTPIITIADVFPTTTASAETVKCTPSITLGGALFSVDNPVNNPNDWPLQFTDSSTHSCYTEEVTISTVPYADDPTASPMLAIQTISEAIFSNTASGILDTFSTAPNDAIDNRRTVRFYSIHMLSANHRGAAAALSPTAQVPFVPFALFATARLLGQWSILPVALFVFGLGINSQIIVPDANTNISPAQNAERDAAAIQSAITAPLLTSTITISTVRTTTLVSTVTAAREPRSTELTVDEGSGAVAAGGALIALAAASTAPSLPPSIHTPFFSLVTFLAAMLLGPWGMLPVALVLLGLGVNGESPAMGQDWSLPLSEADNGITSPEAANNGITTPVSTSSPTPTLRGRGLVTVTTSIMPSAPTETVCVCEPSACATLMAWKVSALVLGVIVGIEVAVGICFVLGSVCLGIGFFCIQ